MKSVWSWICPCAVVLSGCGGGRPPSNPEPTFAPAPDAAGVSDGAGAAEEAEGEPPSPQTGSSEADEAPSARPSAPAGETFHSAHDLVARDAAALRGAATDFDAAVTSSTRDCGAADRFRATVCQLAERICAIADGLPGDWEAERQCTDGRNRCREANRRFADACGQ